jgi:branched-chain amino acid transport system permease protein
MKGLWFGAFAVSAAWPFMAPDYYVNLGSQVLYLALFALSLNLLVGHAGLVSFGQTAFFGGAAYVAALLATMAGWPPILSALAALFTSTTLAGILGALALRTTGIAFMMVTLALGQILWGLCLRWSSMTAGENGISGIVRPIVFGYEIEGARSFFYFSLAVVAIAVVCLQALIKSPYGAALEGTRDQPRRMASLGYDVWLFRWLAFVISGFWAGLAGLLFLYFHRFVSPHALSLGFSAEVLLTVIAGGVGTLAGPFVGASLLTFARYVLSGYVDRWLLVLGVVFVVIVLFMPQGIVPGLQALWTRSRSRTRGVEAPTSADGGVTG